MGPTQVIYALLAMVIVGLLGFFFSRSMLTISHRTYDNESLTQVSGIANEILEEIGNRPFDAATVDAVPDTSASLTPKADFGPDCDPEADCQDIDDFDGKTFYRSREGMDYTIEVSVDYVDEDDPTTVSGSPTFAKQVTLSITSPLVYKQNNPDSLITVQMSRVFTYFKTTI